MHTHPSFACTVPLCQPASLHLSTVAPYCVHYLPMFVTLRRSESVQRLRKESARFLQLCLSPDTSTMIPMPLLLFKFQQPAHRAAASMPYRRDDCQQRCLCHTPSHESCPYSVVLIPQRECYGFAYDTSHAARLGLDGCVLCHPSIFTSLAGLRKTPPKHL